MHLFSSHLKGQTRKPQYYFSLSLYIECPVLNFLFYFFSFNVCIKWHSNISQNYIGYCQNPMQNFFNPKITAKGHNPFVEKPKIKYP